MRIFSCCLGPHKSSEAVSLNRAEPNNSLLALPGEPVIISQASDPAVDTRPTNQPILDTQPSDQPTSRQTVIGRSSNEQTVIERSSNEQTVIGRSSNETRMSKIQARMKFGSTGDSTLLRQVVEPIPVAKRLNSQFVVGETEDISVHYQIGPMIGQPGQFGAAYEVKHLKTGEVRAVKTIKKSKYSKKQDNMELWDALRSEIEIMKKLDHQSIIKFHEVFENKEYVYIVMELCSGGELFDKIQSSTGGIITEKDASKMLKSILEGLKYLHDLKLAHCDLKPDNFLLSNKSKNATIKIIDFGMSKVLQRREYLKGKRGTPLLHGS